MMGVNSTTKVGSLHGAFFVLWTSVYSVYLLTDWLAYLYGRIQSPRPDEMPDQREDIMRAAGFGFACRDTQAS